MPNMCQEGPPYTNVLTFDRAWLQHARDQAAAWAVDGYSETSRAYWLGMQQTLDVLLGNTTERATTSSGDAASWILL